MNKLSKAQARSIILLIIAGIVLFFIFVDPFGHKGSEEKTDQKAPAKTTQKAANTQNSSMTYEKREKLIDTMCSNAYIFKEEYGGDSVYMFGPEDSSSKNLFELTTITETKGQDPDSDVTEIKLSNDLTEITFNPGKEYEETTSFDCTHPDQYIVIAGDKYKKTDINKYSN